MEWPYVCQRPMYRLSTLPFLPAETTTVEEINQLIDTAAATMMPGVLGMQRTAFGVY